MQNNIGIRFVNHKNWTGGNYYLLNLLNSLSSLDNSKQPKIIVYCNKADAEQIRNNVFYNKIDFFYLDNKLSFFHRLANKITNTIIGKYIFDTFPDPNEVQFVFPNPEEYYFKNFKRVFWIPDFQEMYYKNFFSESEYNNILSLKKKTADTADYLVLSSQSAYNDFSLFYPNHKPKVFILNFAVVLPTIELTSLDSVKYKYNIKNDYLIVPNQFWKHKNHLLVIDAFKEVVKINTNVSLLFTGKEHDHRDPEYTQMLKKYVIENNIANIKFLGFIDRTDLLILMKHSKMVIQPSLFEGWSTVIEDAKALSCTILASDLDVNKEQLSDYKGHLLFDKLNAKDLSDKIIQLLNNPIKDREMYNYSVKVKKFANEFVDLAMKIN